MSFKQLLEAMAYVIPIMGVIVLAVWLLIKKQNKTQQALEDAMTREQKDHLMQTRPVAPPAGRNGFAIEALVVEMLDKGSKYHTRLMWHNTVIPNKFMDQLMMADVNVPKEKAEACNLKVGDYVQFWMDLEKQKWDILF